MLNEIQHGAPVLPPIIREAEVLRVVAVSHSTLWRMRKRREFPEPLKIGAASVGWLAADVAHWLAGRRAAAHAGAR